MMNRIPRRMHLTSDLKIDMYAFPHFRFFQVFLSHGGIVTAAIYMTFIEGYRPHGLPWARRFFI